MSFFGVALVVLAQPLDVSAVKASMRREVLRTAPLEAQVLPSLEPSSLSKQSRADLDVIRGRFVATARGVGLEGFRPQTPGGQSTLAAPGPVRGVIATSLKTTAAGATWTLTSNALAFERQGPGCCPPCPCAPGGSCAPCTVCVERGDCRASVTGRQLVMTFTVEGRSLTREDAVVQTIEWFEPAPGPVPRWTLRVEVDSPELPRVEAALRPRLKTLERCVNEARRARPLVVQAMVLPTGRLSVQGEQQEGGACVYKVLSATVLLVQPLEPLPLTLHLEPASP